MAAVDVGRCAVGVGGPGVSARNAIVTWPRDSFQKSAVSEVHNAGTANSAGAAAVDAQCLRERRGAAADGCGTMTAERADMTEKTTWMVVADGARGRVFLVDRGELRPALDHDFVADMTPSHERWADRAGRMDESHGSGGSHMEAPDPKEHAKQKLSKDIADALEHARTTNAVDELILVAPPKFLGYLRGELTPACRQLVKAEHGKDLSQLSVHQLQLRIDELVSG
jgi:protein required for attachment to host cells